MLMKKSLLLPLLAVLMWIPAIRAQVTTEPSPLQEDAQNVVIYFHADEGNKGLINQPASEPIYAHTGVCVKSADGTTTDWKYAPTWGDNDEKYQLSYVSENLWKLVIGDIRTYYGVATEDTVTRLCFVFRNANKTKEGKGEGGTDIFVDIVDSGFQLEFRSSRLLNVIDTETKVKFTASTTEPANIRILVDGNEVASATDASSLRTDDITFSTEGNHVAKAIAEKNGSTIEREITVAVVGDSKQAASAPAVAYGLTKNGDSYTFQLAAPDKSSVLIVGSWNDYQPDYNCLMDYTMETAADGTTFKRFVKTIPASTTGTEFGYYYLVDRKSSYNVGDPYAKLVLDPSNDKYIPEDVYPNLPEYPETKVPSNTVISWHSDNMLDYDWQCTDFKAPNKTDLVIYEMLFRDFTGTEGQAKGNGNVRLAIEKIPYLKALGVNVVEVLPINEFNGNNSWGYNPNFYFAIDKAYGTPQDYKEFIDKCHAEGIAVVLDVVFNQSDWLHPWYRLYPTGSNPFFNAKAPHAYSVLNDWNQGHPLVEQQWKDMLKFWLSEYKVDGFRFDLVKGLGDNDSYANAYDSATNAYNASRVARMKRLHDAMREVNPDAYFINENLASSKEENEMAADGELNWANVNNAGCQYAMGYSSDAALNRMWAKYDGGRTPGSTVAYLESHDEERLAYKQTKWGVAGIKDDHAAAMRRCASAAAQMILVPGSHMIWMFSEMGNAQSTKDNNGGNNTSPKIVNWNLLNDPDNKALMENYSKMIRMRLGNPELFAETADYTVNLGAWANGRYIKARTADKELYAVMNPNTDKEITVTIDFRSNDNAAYTVASKSYESNPSFDAAAKTVTVEPNCYVVLCTDNLASVDGILEDGASAAGSFKAYSAGDGIRVLNAAGAIELYNLEGARIATAPAATDATLPAAPGLYIVKSGSNSAKVLVK